MTMPVFEPIAWKDITAKNRVIFPPMHPEAGDDGWLALHPVEQLQQAFDAGKQATVPEGWQLVPIEPTEEMVSAFWGTIHHGDIELAHAWDAYFDMLAAAPKEKK